MNGLMYGTGFSPLRGLANLRENKTKRVSSYDRTGGNVDYLSIPPGRTAILAELAGAGCITHLWVTIACQDPDHLRKIVLRAFWDGEKKPSVEAPIGDFFGVGHGRPNYFVSLPLQVNNRAMNCYFPMPFAQGASIEVENQCQVPVTFYYYVDYEEYTRLPENAGRFHAVWHSEFPTAAQSTNINNTGKENYVILEAEGRGHYVGCTMYIQGLRTGWWGEGDDMIFIDGEGFPPTLHGTGLEDYFCGAWNFNNLAQPYYGSYHGYHLKGNEDYTGMHAMYRFHVEDPVVFTRSIRVTIEHGHANDRSDDYSSVAYWYQTEPHKAWVSLPPAEKRVARRDYTCK